MLHAIWHWILSVTGVTNVIWYNWWSGFWGGLSMFGIFLVVYKKMNCHAIGCWRLGFHHVNGTSFITCKKHHPTNGNSVKQIHDAHKKAN